MPLSLTKEIVLEWCSKKTYEAQANQSSRASIIRQFGKYLDSIGIKAYVLPKGYYPKARNNIYRIFILMKNWQSFFPKLINVNIVVNVPTDI